MGSAEVVEKEKEKGMKRLILGLVVLIFLGLAQRAFAEGLTIRPGDSIQKILEDQKGKQVIVRLANGEEMAGKVRSITRDLVLLGELAGRDYYDGVIEVGNISAVLIRVKE
jgi:hypothetical protein